MSQEGFQIEARAAILAANAGAEIIAEYAPILSQPDIKRDLAEQKPDGSWRTIADIESEEAILSILHERFPHSTKIGEESNPIYGDDGDIWYIDPCDGTNALLGGVPYVAVCIALERKGRRVLEIINTPLIEQGRSYRAIIDEKPTMFDGSHIHALPISVPNSLDEITIIPHFPRTRTRDHEILSNLANGRIIHSTTWKAGHAYHVAEVAHGFPNVYLFETPSNLPPWEAIGNLLLSCMGGVYTSYQFDTGSPKFTIVTTSQEVYHKLESELRKANFGYGHTPRR
ncbi:MAG: inositol monophosphatase family protein [archaeon]